MTAKYRNWMNDEPIDSLSGPIWIAQDKNIQENRTEKLELQNVPPYWSTAADDTMIKLVIICNLSKKI